MNFEELLETRDKRQTTKMRMPYGFFYKRLIDGKYSNFVEFHDEVADHISFGKFVRSEAEAMENIRDRHQLHFKPNEGDDGVYAIAVEVGHFISFAQLINENPAVVAKKNFIDDTIRDLCTLTEELNSHDIFHVCFAPDNVLARKVDNTVRLLCHGSYYQKLEQDVLWEGDEKFVAPEVLNGGKIDARCDVYSLGRFLAWLYESAGLPLELKSVVAKATDEDPSKRYSSVTDFYKAIVTRQVLRRSVITGIAAVIIALSIVGAYFYMLPSPDDVEFVKPVEEPIPDDLMDDDPTLFGLGADLDSAAIDSIVRMRTQQNDSVRVDDRKMREYQAKAEQIFRKQFQREADAILSKIYNKDKMNLSEKDFMVRSKSVTEELAKKEAELAKAANLGNEKSQRIASEIIDQLTTKKMKELDKDYLGIRKKQAEEDNKTTNTTEKK